MTTVQIALPDDVFSTMHKSPGEVADEMRVAAATIWYAKGLISHGNAIWTVVMTALWVQA